MFDKPEHIKINQGVPNYHTLCACRIYGIYEILMVSTGNCDERLSHVNNYIVRSYRDVIVAANIVTRRTSKEYCIVM